MGQSNATLQLQLHYATSHETTLQCATLQCTTLQYTTIHVTSYTTPHHNCNYTTLITLHYHYNSTTRQLQLHYTTTTTTPTTKTALHHTTSSSCGEVTTATIASTLENTAPTTFSFHQWIRSAIRESQQPTLPIGFVFLKLPPPPCAVLLVYVNKYICVYTHILLSLSAYVIYQLSGKKGVALQYATQFLSKGVG